VIYSSGGPGTSMGIRLWNPDKRRQPPPVPTSDPAKKPAETSR